MGAVNPLLEEKPVHKQYKKIILKAVDTIQPKTRQSSKSTKRNWRRPGRPNPSRPRNPPAKKRKTVLVPRCTSPSHFRVEETDLQRFGDEWRRKLPTRQKVDALLDAVSKIHYTEKPVTEDCLY